MRKTSFGRLIPPAATRAAVVRVARQPTAPLAHHRKLPCWQRDPYVTIEFAGVPRGMSSLLWWGKQCSSQHAGAKDGSFCVG